jgi:apolipoprotein N-acyltransferase
VIDPFGRVITSLPLGSEGVLDALLPQSIAAPPYARFGDQTLAAVLALAFLVVMLSRRRANERSAGQISAVRMYIR